MIRITLLNCVITTTLYFGAWSVVDAQNVITAPAPLLDLLEQPIGTTDSRAFINAASSFFKNRVRPMLSAIHRPCKEEYRLAGERGQACVEGLTVHLSTLPEVLTAAFEGSGIEDVFLAGANQQGQPASSTNMNASGLGPALDAICNTCDRGEMLSSLKKLEAAEFLHHHRDPTCDGMLPDLGLLTAGPLNLNSMELLYNELCSKDPFSEVLCFDEENLPTVFREMELVTTMSYVTGAVSAAGQQGQGSAEISGMMRDVLQQLDIQKVCTAIATGGCCFGNIFEATKHLLKMNCMSAEAEYLELIRVACVPHGGVPEKCYNFDLGGYNVPSKRDCPLDSPFTSLTSFLNTNRDSVRDAMDSKYSNCTIPRGKCPKNPCELYMCIEEETK